MHNHILHGLFADSVIMAGLEFKVWELVCCCLMLVIGSFSNSFVCLVAIKKGPEFRDVPFNRYLMALAFVDLLVSVLAVPFYLVLAGKIPHPTGIYGAVMCKASHALPFWMAGASIYLLVIISFERYTALSNPLSLYVKRKKTRTTLNILLALFVGLIPQLPTIIGISYSSGTAQVGQCIYVWNKEARKSIYPLTFAIQFVFPGIVFIVNFLRIQKCLAKLDHTLYHNLSCARARVTLMQRKRKTIRVVFLVTLAFFICWTPDHVLYFLFQVSNENETLWNSTYYQVTLILGFSNSCVNPLLYAFQSKEFRKNCKSVFSTIFPKRDTYRTF